MTRSDHPDYLLFVQRLPDPQQTVLRLELRRDGAELGHFRKILAREPRGSLTALFAQIGGFDLGTDEQRAAARRQLEGIGDNLTRQLLPRAIHDGLWAAVETRRQESPAPSLMVISDEPWIPWPVLRLRSQVFLGEAFALTRWPFSLTPCLHLPWRRVGLVLTGGSGLEAVARERRTLHGFQETGHRKVVDVAGGLRGLLERLAAETFDGWHFGGYGLHRDDHPDLSAFELEDHESLLPMHLEGLSLRGSRPLVFLNACHAGRQAFALQGLGGFAHAFLRAGAGAVIGPLWEVPDASAPNVAKHIYQHFTEGRTLAEAARLARIRLRDGEDRRGDPSGLGYEVYAHPEAAVVEAESRRARCWSRWPLSIPEKVWNVRLSTPGALLRADFAIVPFHGREKEIQQLRQWCLEGEDQGIRLITGRGGVGKSRLAIELCKEMQVQGWRAGFLEKGDDYLPELRVESLLQDDGNVLVVVDYAETRRALLSSLLRRLLESGIRWRALLLARRREDWWRHLQTEGHGVGALITSAATTIEGLEGLAMSEDDRRSSYDRAAEAFARRLGKAPERSSPPDLKAEHFKAVLLLHMVALAGVEGVELRGQRGILEWFVNRERRFWESQAKTRGLPAVLAPGIAQAMAVITLGGGTTSRERTLDVLAGIDLFEGQPRAHLEVVADVLHDCYPNGRWITPLYPDLMGEHLVKDVLKKAGPNVRGKLFRLIVRHSSGGGRQLAESDQPSGRS